MDRYIRCNLTARQHYNAVHDRLQYHCHGGHYPSVWTSCHNHCHSNGGFGFGFGLGLGYNLMGLITGGINMLGGWLTGGMGNSWGLGGNWGLGGGYDDYSWNGRNQYSNNSNWRTNRNNKTNDGTANNTQPLTDKDYSKINKLLEKTIELTGKNATLENLNEVEALLDEVEKYEQEDENLKAQNNEELEKIKVLLNRYKTNAEEANAVEDAEEAGDAEEADEVGDAEEADEVGDAEEADTANGEELAQELKKASTGEELLKALEGKKWSELDSSAKKALADNELVRNLDDPNSTLTAEQKNRIKEFFYNDRTNKEPDINCAATEIKRAIDTNSETNIIPRNIEGNYSCKDEDWKEDQFKPNKFEFTDKLQGSNTEFTVQYSLVETNNLNEIIYKSKEQEYALQYNGKEYELVQYPWHKGYSIPDIRTVKK